MSESYGDFGEFDDGDGPGDIDWSDEWQTDGDWSIATDSGEGYTDGAALVNDAGSEPDALLLDGVSDDDVEVLVRVKSDDLPTGVTPAPSHGVLAHADDAGNGYAALLAPGQTSQLQVVEYDGESRSSIGAETLDFQIVADSYYWIRFRRQGIFVQASLWEDGEDEPEDWMVDESDSTLTGDGSIGLVSTGSTDGPHHFDVFAYGTDGDTAPSSAPTDQFSETFGANDGDTQPIGWTPQLNADGSEYVVREDTELLGGKYLEIDAGTDEPLTWDIPGESTDVEVLARHRYTDSDSFGLGLVARFDGDDEDYVYWRTSQGSAEVYTILDGSFDDSDFDSGATADEDVWYRSRARLDGDDFYYRIWTDGTTEPSEWDFELTGLLSNVDSPGPVGIHDLNSPNIGELDWISVGIDGAEAPPPGDFVQLSWTNNATGEDGNRVYRSEDPHPFNLTGHTEIADLPPGTESHEDTDVPDEATTLHYAVTAYDGDIEGPPVTGSVVIDPSPDQISGSAQLGGSPVEAVVFEIDETTHDIVQGEADIVGSYTLPTDTGTHHVGAQFADENGQYQTTSKPGVGVSDNGE